MNEGSRAFQLVSNTSELTIVIISITYLMQNIYPGVCIMIRYQCSDRSKFVKSTAIHATLSMLIAVGILSSVASAAPIANPAMWFDAQDIDGDGILGNNQANLSAVTTWVDKGSLQGVQNLSQATATQRPTYMTNVQNGQATVEFDGTNDMLSATSLSLGAFSVFVQLKAPTSAVPTIIMEQSNDLNASGNGFYWVEGMGHTMQVRRGAPLSARNVTSPTPIAWAFQPNLISATQIYDGTNAGHLMYINGALASTNVAGAANPGTATATDTFHLGARFGSGTPIIPYQGQIAELIIYNSKLNAAEQQVVENYLSSKYDSPMAANDHYDGDSNANGDYDADVFGIGRAANGEVSSTGSFGSGLTLTENNSSLSTGEFLLAGHNSAALTLTNDVLDRVWYLDKTGALDATLTFNADELGLDIPGANLLYKALEAGTFSVVPVSAVIVGDQISFSLANAQLLDGYYTLQILIAPEPNSFLLLGIGVLGLARLRRKRSAKMCQAA
jgi:hypothetical protein